jgi:hypothetical protein
VNQSSSPTPPTARRADTDTYKKVLTNKIARTVWRLRGPGKHAEPRRTRRKAFQYRFVALSRSLASHFPNSAPPRLRVTSAFSLAVYGKTFVNLNDNGHLTPDN